MKRILLAVVGGLAGLILLGAGALQRAPVGARPVSASGFAAVVSGAVVTQGFGCTYVLFEPVDVACPTRHFHSGIDLAAPAGTPVFAAADGVCQVITSRGGYGLHVMIQHDLRLASLYGHLSGVLIRDGQAVIAGQEVGLVGSSGMSTGPHLHFEIRAWGMPVDPGRWLPVLQGRRPREPVGP